jgi:hypothetical protein
MGAAAAALSPIMAILGEVGAAIGTVAAIDSATGGHLQKAITGGSGAADAYIYADQATQKRLKTKGLQGYLEKLRNIAPGYAKAHEYRLADNWNKTWQREEQRLQQAEGYLNTFDSLDRPPTNRIGFRRVPEDGAAIDEPVMEYGFKDQP